MSTTQWWWVRHAPVPDGGRIYGQRDLDCDCSDGGIFAALARELPREAVWVTSNLRRATQTAAAIHAAMGQPHEPVVVPELAEQDLGDWQGLDRQKFLASRVPRRPFWFSAANERAPGGESFDDLVARASSAIKRLTERFAGRTIIAVTHGGTIKAALALALRLESEAALAFAIENCSITRLDHIEPEVGVYEWRVQAVNHRPWTRSVAGEVPAAARGTAMA
jgi:broad specificity phosphatase PhoE